MGEVGEVHRLPGPSLGIRSDGSVTEVTGPGHGYLAGGDPGLWARRGVGVNLRLTPLGRPVGSGAVFRGSGFWLPPSPEYRRSRVATGLGDRVPRLSARSRPGTRSTGRSTAPVDADTGRGVGPGWNMSGTSAVMLRAGPVTGSRSMPDD